ncbi:YHS domain-containing protein, partial [Verrucomicrobia bacterium]|nr:YHS domain-containing protein [Verrucomicrobiota bacterium]
MKKIITLLTLGAVLFGGFSLLADDKKAEKCPISGKAVDKDHAYAYEGHTYHFCCGDCEAKFKEARENSIYHKIGGKAAMNAAV